MGKRSNIMGAGLTTVSARQLKRLPKYYAGLRTASADAQAGPSAYFTAGRRSALPEVTTIRPGFNPAELELKFRNGRDRRYQALPDRPHEVRTLKSAI